MGWCSATNIFDATIEATQEVLNEIYGQYCDYIPKHEMLVKIARPLANELDDRDWDCHRESDFWDQLKWDLWPVEAQEEKEEMEQDD